MCWGDTMFTADRIKAARIQKNLTQRSMSEKLNINLRTYQKYESGEISPPLKQIEKISEILGVSPDLLINITTIDIQSKIDESKRYGKRIQECRQRKGFTQAQLAELIGKSEKDIADYELGNRSVGLDVLSKIGQALEVNPVYFATGIKPETKEQEKLTLAILDIFRSCGFSYHVSLDQQEWIITDSEGKTLHLNVAEWWEYIDKTLAGLKDYAIYLHQTTVRDILTKRESGDTNE